MTAGVAAGVAAGSTLPNSSESLVSIYDAMAAAIVDDIGSKSDGGSVNKSADTKGAATVVVDPASVDDAELELEAERRLGVPRDGAR